MVVSATTVQLWKTEMVSESGCKTLNDMILEPESGGFVWSTLGKRGII